MLKSTMVYLKWYNLREENVETAKSPKMLKSTLRNFEVKEFLFGRVLWVFRVGS